MKAAVLTGIEKIEIQDFPSPQMKKSDDVLLKVRAVGVCGSDIHYYKTGRIGDQIIEYPFRIGHEFVATVSEIGDEVKKVKPGDLVAIDPAISCGNCDQCFTFSWWQIPGKNSDSASTQHGKRLADVLRQHGRRAG